MSGAKRIVVAAILALCFQSTAVHAQSPIRILVGYSPGGAVDTLARFFAEKLGEETGRTVIVENRSGASGQLAMMALKAALPDGNTLAVTPDSAVTLQPHVTKLSYDPVNDLLPVASIGGWSYGLAVAAGGPVQDLAGFIKEAKTSKTLASYSGVGVGTPMHFMGELFAKETRLQLVHVPYRGGPAATMDLLGGQLGTVILPLNSILSYYRAGKIAIVAQSGAQRSPLAPKVPTFKELGYPLEFTGWVGLFAPAKMPADVVAKYNDIINRSLRTPAVRERMRSLDMDIREVAAADLAKIFKDEYELWGRIVKSSGVKIE